MHKHSIRLAFSLLLSSVVLFLTLAAVQPPRRSWQEQPSPPQQEICARLSAAEAHQLGLTTAATTTVLCDPDPPTPQAEWSDTCDIHRMEITGMGMGNKTTAINPQTVALTDPVKVSWLWVQVAGRYSNTTHTPESVTFTTDTPESLILNQPASNTSEGYTFETELQPAGQITAFVNNPGDTFKTPRGLVLYAKREVEGRWTSIGKTMNSYVYHNTHTEVFTFPRLTRITDLYITAVVINNQADSNSLILEARAGEGLTQTVPIAGPADGSLLNIIPLTLTNVPANTDQVTLTLHSPTDNEDSPVWVGANVSYRCGADLAVTKTVNDPTPDAEEIITYTVTVVNNGPEDATRVSISDTLPTGITYKPPSIVSYGSYTNGLWTVGFLPSGAKATLTITAKVGLCPNDDPITNTARIATVTPFDWNVSNNEARVSIDVFKKYCYIYLPVVFRDYHPFTNGDFETGNLIGWIGGQGPFLGHGSGLPHHIVWCETNDTICSYTARLGDASFTNNNIPVGYGYIAQTFTVDKRYLQIRYRVLTYDIVKSPDSDKYFDTFEVSLNTPPNQISNDERNNKGCTTTVLNPVGTLIPTDNLVFCGGYAGSKSDVGTLHDLTWRIVTLDLQNFQETNITLYFTLWSREYQTAYWNDEGVYNTLVYIDDIKFNDDTPSATSEMEFDNAGSIIPIDKDEINLPRSTGETIPAQR